MTKKSLIFNVFLVIFELIGFIWALIGAHTISFKYYTNLSNMLALISAIFFIISYFINNKVLKNISSYLKLISTAGLTITFLVVIFALGPQAAISEKRFLSYFKFLIPNGFLCLHLICPILEFISFVFFENHKNLNKLVWYILSASYTFIYGIIMINLVYFASIEPPYFFLDAKKIGYLQTFGIGIILVAFTFFISFLLIKLNNKLFKENHD